MRFFKEGLSWIIGTQRAWQVPDEQILVISMAGEPKPNRPKGRKRTIQAMHDGYSFKNIAITKNILMLGPSVTMAVFHQHYLQNFVSAALVILLQSHQKYVYVILQ